MLSLVIRKIFSNSWKVICLLLGSILVVAMVCSIPIFSSGILQRMLTKDLERLQTESGRYPGYLVFNSNFSYYGGDTLKAMEILRSQYADMTAAVPAERLVFLESTAYPNMSIVTNPDKNQRQSMTISCISDFPSHVELVKGRLFEPGATDGVIEVVVTDSALKTMKLLFDHEYEVNSYRQKTGEPYLFKIRIVGIFTSSDSQDLYWYKHIGMLSGTVIADKVSMEQMAAQHPELLVGEHQLVSAYDYHQFRIQDIKWLQGILDQGNDFSEKNTMTTRFIASFSSVIEKYVVREAELKLTLQILIIPILLMLIFYVFMVSQLMVRSETGVISVLESRGAKRLQIMSVYGVESLFYAVVTFIVGPVLGLLMVRVIGASNGFLEFVNRKALRVQIDKTVILYALIVVVLIVITTLIPVFMQSRTTIVEQKRQKSRISRAPFWKKAFLDIILLAISLYALYRLNEQRVIQKETGLSALDIKLDFLFYLSSTLFIIGAGLLFMRLYPWLVKLIYLVGRRFWSPVLYASFHQISRSGGQEQFLMIFLIMALSIGLFNANAARTINRNTEDVIHCKIGSDIVLNEYWQKYDTNGNPIIEMDPFASRLDAGSANDATKAVKYKEPDFSKYTKLAGVDSAARVFRSDQAMIRKDKSIGVSVMAVDPYDFARTAWTRSDLYRHHMNEYMNVMMSTPSAIILSRNLKEEMDIEVGDGIFYSIGGSDIISGVVVAFVDYWPGYSPATISSNGKVVKKSLLVANFEYVLSKSSIQPYEIWIKRAAGMTDKAIYDDIESKKIRITTIASANQQIVTAKNDPKLQGTNGALTLGFIVSMLICAAGFLIYWIMSVQARVLQFGIYRAMGLSKAAVVGMLVSEQVLVSGVAILVGDLIGNLSSFLYVPLFQLVYSTADQPIPFRIVSQASDTSKIFLVLGFLLLVCFGVLTRLILRIKIDQAVKLGEE